MSEATKVTVQALSFPCTVFRTQRRMDDYGTDDMRCGDLSETELKTNFNMRDVSTKANPYTLTKITAFKQLQYMHYSVDEKSRR